MTLAHRYILLVEDHQDLAITVGEYLEAQKFKVDYAATGPMALTLAAEENYDVIVLDINLPGIDGLEVCRQLRTDARKPTPVIMLTARDQLEDKVAGFKVGADDYLVKPFELQELAVRIEALIRRESGAISDGVYEVGSLKLDIQREIAIRDGKRLKLSPRSFDILHVLMRRSPNVVSRRDLEKEIWGDEPPDSDALRSHVYNLRRVVDKPFDVPLIETLAGKGFAIREPNSN